MDSMQWIWCAYRVSDEDVASCVQGLHQLCIERVAIVWVTRRRLESEAEQ